MLRWMAAAVLALLYWCAVERGTSSFAEDNTDTREAREDTMGASNNTARSG